MPSSGLQGCHEKERASNNTILTKKERTKGFLVIGMSMGAVEAAAKPSFNMFNKNLMYSYRPGEDGLKNSIDGGGNWVKVPNPTIPNGAYQDSMNYMPGNPANNTLFGIGSVMPNGAMIPISEGQKEANGQSPEPYTMFYRSPNHTRCEECDKYGKIKGTMLVTDHGVQKMINYEALSAKNAEDSPTNVNPTQFNNPQNEGVRVPSAFDGLQNYNPIPLPMSERTVIPNIIQGQMGPLNGGIPQQMGLPSSAQSQLPLMPQQNNSPYMLAQANNALPNGITPQTTPSMGTYASQMPSALSNAGQGNQQQMLQRLAESLGPSNQVDNQMIAQRANELMSGVYQNQQPSWNDGNRQIPAVALVNPSMGTGVVANPSPDQANMAAFKALLQNGMAVPMVLFQAPGQQQLTMANSGGTQSKDNSVAAVLPKEQTTELKQPTVGSEEVMTAAVRKLANDIMEMMPKNEDGKEPTEQTVLSAR